MVRREVNHADSAGARREPSRLGLQGHNRAWEKNFIGHRLVWGKIFFAMEAMLNNALPGSPYGGSQGRALG